MINIAIVDDERAVREEIKYFLKAEKVICNILEYDNGTSFLQAMLETKYDLVFIDMHLGDIEGVKVAKMLRVHSKHTLIVFATAYDTYAITAFELDAVDYLLKPFEPKRFHDMLEKVYQKLSISNVEQNDNAITIQSNKKIVILSKQDIIYVETQSRKTVIVTQQEQYPCSISIIEIEGKLSTSHYFRVHKSFLVKISAIKEIHHLPGQNYYLVLKGFESLQIPVSRHRIRELKMLLNTN